VRDDHDGNRLTELVNELFDSLRAERIERGGGLVEEQDTRLCRERAAGAIVVLMVILLLMNSVAIWLRNRYEQKW
jgi:hypothetical protein